MSIRSAVDDDRAFTGPDFLNDNLRLVPAVRTHSFCDGIEQKPSTRQQFNSVREFTHADRGEHLG
jgi:hypothetical protein